ncbi:lipopolysaccharide biosynthesis protein [Pseudomonas graminis]
MKKEFLSNFAGLASSNLINLLIPLITMPYLSRVLGSDSYGVVLLFSSITIFTMIITDYSTNITGVRDCAEAISDHDKIKKVYETNQNTRLILSFLLLPISVAYIHFYMPGINLYLATELIVVGSIGYYLSAPWFHQGTSSLHVFSAINVTLRILQLFAIFLFIKTPDAFSLVMRFNAYSTLIAGALIFTYRKNKFKISETRTLSLRNNTLKSGANSFIGDFSPNFYSNIPPLIIGANVSPVVFACYSIAIRLINISGNFQTIAARSIYPIIVKGGAGLRNIMIINIIISLVPFLALTFFGSYIVRILLGPGYDLSVEFINIGAVSILLYSVICSYTYGYFFPKKKDLLFRNISIVCSIIPALVGYPLMYHYGAYGAVIMLVIARAMFMILFAYYHKKDSAL